MERIKDLLFNHINQKQIIFKNTFWLAFAEGVTRFLKLILIIYVGKILGATNYGVFNFALAFVALFAVFSDFGVSQITTRELSREEEKEKEFSAILSLKLLLSLGTLILILAGSFFITPDPEIQKIIWILAIYTIAGSFSGIIFAFFQARQRMEYESWAKIFQAAIVTGAGLFVILNFPSVENLSYSYLFASLVTLIFILLFFHFKVYHLSLSWEKSVWQRLLSMSWPLVLAGAFSAIYTSTDSTMMGYFGQITQTGWYNAASRIIGVALIPTGLISTSFYPVLSKFFKESKDYNPPTTPSHSPKGERAPKLQRIWDYFMESMIFLALPITIGGIALAPRIIDWIYDPSFFPTGKESILAFQILIVMAGISFLSNPFNQILIISNQQKKLFWVALGGAIIDIILNAISIPRYSLYGAAISTVFTALLVFFLLFKFTLELTPIKPLNLRFLQSFIGAGLSSLPMYFVIIQPKIYNLNVILTISIGAGFYLICFFIYKKILNKILPTKIYEK